MLVCLIALVTFRRTHAGSNDDEIDNDPEDPDYKEEHDYELEGKFYRPLLDHIEPRVSQI